MHSYSTVDTAFSKIAEQRLNAPDDIVFLVKYRILFFFGLVTCLLLVFKTNFATLGLEYLFIMHIEVKCAIFNSF